MIAAICRSHARAPAEGRGSRRNVAKRFGVEVEPLNLAERAGTPRTDPSGSPLAMRGGPQQFDITLDACTSVAIYFTPTTPVPLLKMYSKGITFITGRVHARADLPAVLDCCASGHFHPEHVTSRVVPFTQSPEAMTDPGPKLVFTNDL